MIRRLIPVVFVCVMVMFAQTARAGDVSAAHYRYEQSGDETLDYWISDKSLRMDIRQGATTRVMLFRTQESPHALYLMNPSRKQAQRITRQGIQQLIGAMNKRMQLMMEQMPPEQRRRLKETLGSTRTEIVAVPDPEFRSTVSSTWRGRQATEGEFWLDGEKRGSAVLLNEPPLTLPGNSDQVMEKFHDLLSEFIGMLKGMPGQGGGSSLEKTENLLGSRQFRLARFEADNRWIELRSWTVKPVERSRFEVPDDYRVESVETMMSGAF